MPAPIAPSWIGLQPIYTGRAWLPGWIAVDELEASNGGANCKRLLIAARCCWWCFPPMPSPLRMCRSKTAGPIPADHLDFWMHGEPGHDRFSRAIWQEIKGLARLDVKQKRSIRISTVLATWDIRSDTCALTMSSTQIISSLSTERARFSTWLISLLFRTDIPSSQHRSFLSSGGDK
jgi:hypothetical protein